MNLTPSCQTHLSARWLFFIGASLTCIIALACGGSSDSTPPTHPPSIDTHPPTAPSGLAASQVTPSGLLLTWTASTDDTAVAGYRVYGNEALAGTITSGTRFQATGLAPSTTYSYTVAAFDAAGNASARSSALAVTTAALGPLPVIDSFTAEPTTIASGQSCTLSWAVTGQESLSLSPDVGAVTGTSRMMFPPVTRTYTLTATNPAGSVNRSVTVTVTGTHPMPAGIPNPPFGIGESRPPRPDPWSAPVAGFYFVNEQTGSDVGNAWGTPSSPRRTIPALLPAGSCVELQGTYSQASGGGTFLAAKGTQGSWVANTSGPAWIVSAGSEPAVFAFPTFISGSSLYLEGLRFGDGRGLQVSSSSVDMAADRLMVRNCVLRGDGLGAQGGLMVGGRASAPVTNLLILGNTISDCGEMLTTQDQDAAPLIVENHASNVWVLDNVMHTCTAGVRFGGSQPTEGLENAHHLYFGGNHVYNTRQAGFAVKYAVDIVCSGNHIHDIVDTDWSPSKAVGGQYAPHRFWVLNNHLHHQRYGVRIASTNTGVPADVYILGNIIHDIRHGKEAFDGGAWSEAGISVMGSTGAVIANNTLYACDGGINATFAPCVIENNIISQILENTPSGNHLFLEETLSTKVVRNNLFDQGGQPVKIRWGSAAAQGLTAWQTASGNGAGCLQGDPRFQSAATADFRLLADSPARDSGLASAVYQTFFERYGLSITQDAAGQLRPAGVWDMGALERPQ